MEFPENILSILPDESRTKFERMVADRAAAHAVVRSTSDALQAARHDFQLLEGRVREQLRGFGGYEVLSPGQAFRTGAAAKAQNETEERLMEPVRAAERRRDLSADAHERAVAVWERFAFVEEVERWLERMGRLGAPRLQHFVPKLPKPKDASAEIQRLRADLKALDEAWQAAENAPLPAAILRQQAIAEIDAIAKEGELRIHANNRSGEPLGLRRAIRIGQAAVVLPGEDKPFMALEGTGGAPLMVWLQRDAIVERAEAMIAKLPQTGALSDDERDREFTRLSARRLEIERQEEALVVAMEHEGRVVQRRRDLDPRALLEVAEV